MGEGIRIIKFIWDITINEVFVRLRIEDRIESEEQSISDSIVSGPKFSSTGPDILSVVACH